MLTQVLPIKFDPADYKALKKTSKELGVPMAQIVREATKNKLQRITKPHKKKLKLSDLANYAFSGKYHHPKLTDDELIYNNGKKWNDK